MVTLLMWLLDERIKLSIEEQITTPHNIFTLKIETLLSQRMLSMANTQTAHMYWVYEPLQQENMRLQNKVQDLTRDSGTQSQP